jgi:hypothetical protein
MKKYIERLQNEKTPHERRSFAMQFAGVITAFFLLRGPQRLAYA